MDSCVGQRLAQEGKHYRTLEPCATLEAYRQGAFTIGLSDTHRPILATPRLCDGAARATQRWAAAAAAARSNWIMVRLRSGPPRLMCLPADRGPRCLAGTRTSRTTRRR